MTRQLPILDAIDHRVVLLLGPGGVGKTTTSAAAGLGWAKRGQRVVVLTIDPARRLAEILGIDGAEANNTHLVARFGQGELWATMLDSADTFTQLVRAEASSSEQAERILANPLFTNLTRSLSGTGEYMAAERLHQLNADPRFDRVVVDTPPSRHAFDFLDAPSQLVRFVDHRLYRTVFAPRGLAKTFTIGPRLIIRTLGAIVGGKLVEDVVAFFADFETMDQGFRRRADELDSVLTGSDTGHILVCAPRREPLLESSWIAQSLWERNRDFQGLVVNRAAPIVARGAKLPAKGKLAENVADFQGLADAEHKLVDRLLPASLRTTKTGYGRIAERVATVTSLADIADIADTLG